MEGVKARLGESKRVWGVRASLVELMRIRVSFRRVRASLGELEQIRASYSELERVRASLSELERAWAR